MSIPAIAGHHDLRRADRQPCDQRVTVVWRDAAGQEKFVQAKALDISEQGLRLEVPEPLPCQIYLTLRAEKLGLRGNASVRHCMRVRGSRYAVGLEFSAGMCWKRKD